MKRLTDEEWVAQARGRMAISHDWATPEDELFAAPTPTATTTPAPRPLLCPYCVTHPALANFQRSEVPSGQPLKYCAQCYGFWAAGDALTGGVADDGDDSPALTATPGPRRCRACFGHLKPDG